MNHFEKKTHTTPRGYTYTYYTTPRNPSTTHLPTLLFQHGWPDHAGMWFPIVTHLLTTHSIANPILIPDMLGYDGTSKPTNACSYTNSGLTSDLISILTHETTTSVISIGHDWGAHLASRLYNYHPTHVAGLILLNVAYTPPQRHPFSLAATNTLTSTFYGYPALSYWELFTSASAPDILQTHLPKLYSALHSADPTSMRRLFCTPSALEKYLSDASIAPEHPLRPYADDPAFKAAFIRRMRRDGFEGPMQWYIATTENLRLVDDAALPEERDTVRVPTFYVGATDDAVCRPEGMGLWKMKGLLPYLEEGGMLEAGHWVTYEKPVEVAELMAGWLRRMGFCG